MTNKKKTKELIEFRWSTRRMTTEEESKAVEQIKRFAYVTGEVRIKDKNSNSKVVINVK